MFEVTIQPTTLQALSFVISMMNSSPKKLIHFLKINISLLPLNILVNI